jgi:hypothetical protein
MRQCNKEDRERPLFSKPWPRLSNHPFRGAKEQEAKEEEAKEQEAKENEIILLTFPPLKLK